MKKNRLTSPSLLSTSINNLLNIFLSLLVLGLNKRLLVRSITTNHIKDSNNHKEIMRQFDRLNFSSNKSIHYNTGEMNQKVEQFKVQLLSKYSKMANKPSFNPYQIVISRRNYFFFDCSITPPQINCSIIFKLASNDSTPIFGESTFKNGNISISDNRAEIAYTMMECLTNALRKNQTNKFPQVGQSIYSLTDFSNELVTLESFSKQETDIHKACEKLRSNILKAPKEKIYVNRQMVHHSCSKLKSALIASISPDKEIDAAIERMETQTNNDKIAQRYANLLLFNSGLRGIDKIVANVEFGQHKTEAKHIKKMLVRSLTILQASIVDTNFMAAAYAISALSHIIFSVKKGQVRTKPKDMLHVLNSFESLITIAKQVSSEQFSVTQYYSAETALTVSFFTFLNLLFSPEIVLQRSGSTYTKYSENNDIEKKLILLIKMTNTIAPGNELKTPSLKKLLEADIWLNSQLPLPRQQIIQPKSTYLRRDNRHNTKNKSQELNLNISRTSQKTGKNSDDDFSFIEPVFNIVAQNKWTQAISRHLSKSEFHINKRVPYVITINLPLIHTLFLIHLSQLPRFILIDTIINTVHLIRNINIGNDDRLNKFDWNSFSHENSISLKLIALHIHSILESTYAQQGLRYSNELLIKNAEFSTFTEGDYELSRTCHRALGHNREISLEKSCITLINTMMGELLHVLPLSPFIDFLFPILKTRILRNLINEASKEPLNRFKEKSSNIINNEKHTPEKIKNQVMAKFVTGHVMNMIIKTNSLTPSIAIHFLEKSLTVVSSFSKKDQTKSTSFLSDFLGANSIKAVLIKIIQTTKVLVEMKTAKNDIIQLRHEFSLLSIIMAHVTHNDYYSKLGVTQAEKLPNSLESYLAFLSITDIDTFLLTYFDIVMNEKINFTKENIANIYSILETKRSTIENTQFHILANDTLQSLHEIVSSPTSATTIQLKQMCKQSILDRIHQWEIIFSQSSHPTPTYLSQIQDTFFGLLQSVILPHFFITQDGGSIFYPYAHLKSHMHTSPFEDTMSLLSAHLLMKTLSIFILFKAIYFFTVKPKNHINNNVAAIKKILKKRSEEKKLTPETKHRTHIENARPTETVLTNAIKPTSADRIVSSLTSYSEETYNKSLRIHFNLFENCRSDILSDKFNKTKIIKKRVDFKSKIQIELESLDFLIRSHLNKKTRKEVKLFWGYHKKGVSQSVSYRNTFLSIIKSIREIGGLSNDNGNLDEDLNELIVEINTLRNQIPSDINEQDSPAAQSIQAICDLLTESNRNKMLNYIPPAYYPSYCHR